MVFIQENRRTANLYSQLLCPLGQRQIEGGKEGCWDKLIMIGNFLMLPTCGQNLAMLSSIKYIFIDWQNSQQE